MSWWVYFAGNARASEADTLKFVIQHGVLYRPAHNANGSLIANVGKLRPGDQIFLVYRGSGPRWVRVRGRIAAVERPVAGTKVIDRVRGDLASEMSRRGYPLLADGYQEVIRLEEAEHCDLRLEGGYGGNNAIHKVAEVDRSAVRTLLTRSATTSESP